MFSFNNVNENYNKVQEYLNKITINITNGFIYNGNNSFYLRQTKIEKSITIPTNVNKQRRNKIVNENWSIFKILNFNGIEIENKNLNISELENGFYFVIYKSNDKFKTKKVKIE